MLNAISERRSIRKYKDIPVPQDLIEEILQAGILAPSSKNRQPWRFVVVSGNAKTDMLSAMEQGLIREAKNPMLPDSKQHLSAARHTLEIMRQAPVTIFVLNTLGIDLSRAIGTEDRIYEICNAQSIGAAIQNMTITAAESGLGSLWICDTFFAYGELKAWLNTDGELFAALTIGYGDEHPGARPRKAMRDVVEWKN